MPGKRQESEVKEVKELEARRPEAASSSSSSSANSPEDIKAEVFNERWDRTEELLSDKVGNKWKLRLDSIARLIEGNSTCAAIAIEKSSFLIATNKNFIPEARDQGYILIDTVMSFFKKVANSENTEDDFQNTFKKICREAITGLQLPAFIRDHLLDDDKFIQGVMGSEKKQDFRELRDYLSEHIEYGHFPRHQGAAFVICVALMKDFKKVIKFIKENKDELGDIPAETKSFIKAIKGYEAKNIIDREKLSSKIFNSDTREKMHAEMRILALIEERLSENTPYNNYIGISKLCCLDCHTMIYAVNNAMAYKNSIEIRGAHNVLHSGAWNAPFNITGNPSAGLIQPVTGRRSSSSTTVESFVGAVTKGFNTVYTGTHGKLTGAEGVSEYADYSQSSRSSEDEGEGYYSKYCRYLESMEKTLQLRKEVCSDSPELSEGIEILKVGLRIYKGITFKRVCELDLAARKKLKPKDVQRDIQLLLASVEEIEAKLLAKFLENPIYSGQKANSYFSSVDFVQILSAGNVKRRKAYASSGK